MKAGVALRVDQSDELPLGVQLAWRLRAMITTGELRPGDRLPSLREAADEAGLNVNTVRAVYGRLEAQGLVVSHKGRGTFVAVGADDAGTLSELAREVVARSRAAGIDPRDVARLLYAAGAEASEPVGEGTGLPDVGREADQAAVRRELRRQIGRLEAQLASYPGARAEGEQRHPLLRPKAHVAGVDELEEVRDELIERLKRARAAAERKGMAQSRARGRRERIAGDPDAHRWERITRDEVGDPGCGELRSVPRFGPIGAIAGWWRVKVSSGCP